MVKQLSDAEAQSRLRDQKTQREDKRHNELIAQLKALVNSPPHPVPDFAPILKENSDILQKALESSQKLSSKQFEALTAKMDKQIEATNKLSAEVGLMTAAINRKPTKWAVIRDFSGSPIGMEAVSQKGN